VLLHIFPTNKILPYHNSSTAKGFSRSKNNFANFQLYQRALNSSKTNHFPAVTKSWAAKAIAACYANVMQFDRPTNWPLPYQLSAVN
jgi:hypothetical protein